jgi:aspartyl-tRNA(Asn)/glutamyl-tRNA(Gln) amidotransferase subunit A
MTADTASKNNPSATITALAAELEADRSTAEGLAARCLDRIADPAGEGTRAFLHVDPPKTLDLARMSDRLRGHGVVPGPLAGIPVSLKDLFDIAGEVTRAGSTILAAAPPARRDARVVARLRAAGAVFVGRTNMTEFAFSGVGLNAHYGTPTSPWDRPSKRIPGGSTSGGAVSVADGMATLAIGSDTGGSCRIPAALCGLTGYKPTAARIPLTGVFPLSRSLDSIGSMGHSVACVALADAIMAGEDYTAPVPGSMAGMRFALPRSFVLDDMEETVASAFEAVLKRLRDGGAIIEEMAVGEIDAIPEIQKGGGIITTEALAVHRERLAANGGEFDPRVRSRIEMALEVSGADYVTYDKRRGELIARFSRRMAGHDAMILPTVPILAPPISAFAAEEDYVRLNRLLLRNPTCFNQLDGCAISLPCHAVGTAPVGLMLASSHGRDKRLLHVAATVEAAIAPMRV